MGETFYHNRYDFSTLNDHIATLQKRFSFVSVHIIGQSVLGLPIYELRIGNGEKEVHWNGSFHANEWITTPLLMKIVEEYLQALEGNSEIESVRALELYYSTSLSVVPMVNPDGVNLVHHGAPHHSYYRERVKEMNEGHINFLPWKANIRGVDLNNQFPAHWEVEKRRKPESPTFRDYPGKRPLSEPESLAMYKLVQDRNFTRVLCFHSQGEVIYWGYQHLEPSRAKNVVEAFRSVSQYIPVQTVDSHAGFKDWFIFETGEEGYTVEIGKGINPLPFSTFQHHVARVKKLAVQSLLL
ncbi:peptidase M14 [Pontibacillus halophilus JSM 076056 = DSM 19796]|uniref:Peptidase M14 n=1 Tax=Pontibacillus halophilus JSM 076056 = DSM 19796 TaxID=1385510 RepID=A0A0A5GCF6_9BACI|nr:M14 family metallocarboxypeptidase [Pontibacillus halophilus]KGX90871.1 peptidase M14 [Pontibacillus halophilus JSM 076056 = DSM 19796]